VNRSGGVNRFALSSVLALALTAPGAAEAAIRAA
jgi:hypothetical protein